MPREDQCRFRHIVTEGERVTLPTVRERHVTRFVEVSFWSKRENNTDFVSLVFDDVSDIDAMIEVLETARKHLPAPAKKRTHFEF